MIKTIGIVVAVALLSFAAGFWTKATVAVPATLAAPSTISPADMHQKLDHSTLQPTPVENFN
jgi:hypothetical protein